MHQFPFLIGSFSYINLVHSSVNKSLSTPDSKSERRKRNKKQPVVLVPANPVATSSPVYESASYSCLSQQKVKRIVYLAERYCT